MTQASLLRDMSSTPQASRRHYDVSDEFFAVWLGDDLTYSCAVWDESDPADTLGRRRAGPRLRVGRPARPLHASTAGLWRPGRSGLGPIEVELDHTEIILVLSGTGRLEVAGGAPLDLAPGGAARIDVGAHTRWMVDEEFTELWLYV